MKNSVAVVTTVLGVVVPSVALANSADVNNKGTGTGREEKKLFIEFIERDDNSGLHYISNSKWLPVSSTLVIAFKGVGFKYTFLGEQGKVIEQGEFPARRIEANTVQKVLPTETCPGVIEDKAIKSFLELKRPKYSYDVSQNRIVVLSIEDRYYRGAKSLSIEYWPTEHSLTQKYYRKFEIVESLFDWAELSNFAITPLVDIQIGKNNPTGEQVEGTSFALGVQYLFFYRHREYRFWDNVGGGFSYSYSKTPVWDETAQEWEDTLVATTGVVLAYKFWSTPLMFVGGVGCNVNGDDRFLQVLVGFSVKPGD